MSYRNLRKKQNECRDIDTLKSILEDALIELKHKEKKLNSVLEDNKVLSKTCNKLIKENTKNLKALEIIKECVGLKMSVDEDIGLLYVPITKCFQPLEQNIVIVGCVKGKDKYFVRLTTDEVQEIDEMTYLNLGGEL